MQHTSNESTVCCVLIQDLRILNRTVTNAKSISKTNYYRIKIVLVFLLIMEPRPPESKESGKKKSLRKHPHEYDIEQLDLQWLPKVQELCQKTGETTTKTKYGVETDDVDAAIRLTSTVSKKDNIKEMGEINVRQLKDLLKGMSRKELG